MKLMKLYIPTDTNSLVTNVWIEPNQTYTYIMKSEPLQNTT